MNAKPYEAETLLSEVRSYLNTIVGQLDDLDSENNANELPADPALGLHDDPLQTT